MSAINALEALERVSGSNAKLAILHEESRNELLKQVFVASFDPYVNYGVAKFTMPKPMPGWADPASSLDDEHLSGFVNGLLPRLASRELSGNAAKKELEMFLAGCTDVVQKWCKRILIKNLRCGVQATTVCKVWDGLIRSFNVQLARTLNVGETDDGSVVVNDDVSYPAYVDPKLDGLRCLVVKSAGSVIMYTRSGREITTLPTIKATLERAPFDDVVLDGEAMGADWNESSSVMGSKKSKKDDKNMVLHVFDCMTLGEWRRGKVDARFSERTVKASNLCKLAGAPCVRKVENVIVTNEAELVSVYTDCLDRGYEGVMVKRPDGGYNFDGDRDDTVSKMKPVTTYEGTIVGWYEGRDGTKNAGSFGGFNVLLPNGVVTNCGGGLVAQKVEQAKIMLEGPDTYVGRVVEVEGQPPLTKEGKIRFPRVLRYREHDDVDRKVLEAYQAWRVTMGRTRTG